MEVTAAASAATAPTGGSGSAAARSGVLSADRMVLLGGRKVRMWSRAHWMNASHPGTNRVHLSVRRGKKGLESKIPPLSPNEIIHFSGLLFAEYAGAFIPGADFNS